MEEGGKGQIKGENERSNNIRESGRELEKYSEAGGACGAGRVEILKGYEKAKH
jgi:hypothetical protein